MVREWKVSNRWCVTFDLGGRSVYNKESRRSHIYFISTVAQNSITVICFIFVVKTVSCAENAWKFFTNLITQRKFHVQQKLFYNKTVCTKFYLMKKRVTVLILNVHSLETHQCFYNSWTKHDMEMKLTSIGFSHHVSEDSRSLWLQTLGNQLIDRFSYIRY